MLGQRGWGDRPVDHTVFEKLSDLSYSVYLFHGFFLSILGARIEAALYPLGYSPAQCVGLIILAVAPLTLFLSHVTYTYVEAPGMRWGKILSARLVAGRGARIGA